MTVDTDVGDEPIASAASVLSRFGAPGAGARLRDEHDRDRHGRCRGCPHAGTVAPWFPCRLRLIGEAAVLLGRRSRDDRRGGRDDDR